ncbi:FAD-dependent monooxygenase [Thalassococcus sp. S3]|uniref:FAD-dependent monooxygenase n=1 Tax=Thalassococcus sp. S3 TaxID=2017482 RepID=UPI0013EEBA09|nr:FAD-dependent monooxygenase [Thalassococcus sp. S3]
MSLASFNVPDRPANPDVVIVGAGPVGLYAAARLAQFGASVLILERASEPMRRGSKALCVQSDVIDLLDNVGCGHPVREAGCAWNLSRTYVRNTEVRTTRFDAGPTGTPAFVNLPQWQIEDLLRAAGERTGRVRIVWGAEFDGLEQDAEDPDPDRKVDIRFQQDGAVRTVSTTFLLGCDGVRSNVRETLGVEWLGRVHADRFLIVDAEFDVDWPKERRFWFDAPSNPGRQIVVHPQPGRMWRLDWQLPKDCDPKAEIAPHRIADRIETLAGTREHRLEWASTYRFHQRHAARMRLGNVFLLGDAAHALPPFGARGMNSGLQDAENLCWKLAAVLEGQAAADILTTFDRERFKAARENVAITGKTIRFMVPPTRLHHWYRNALVRGAARFPALNGLINSGKMSTPTSYRGLDTVQRRTRGNLRPGDIVPNLSLGSDALRAHLAGGFGLIAARQSPAGERIEAALPFISRLGVTLIWADDAEYAASHKLTDLLRQAAAPALLVRPDGYLAGVLIQDIRAELTQLLKPYGIRPAPVSGPSDRTIPVAGISGHPTSTGATQ